MTKQVHIGKTCITVHTSFVNISHSKNYLIFRFAPVPHCRNFPYSLRKTLSYPEEDECRVCLYAPLTIGELNSNHSANRLGSRNVARFTSRVFCSIGHLQRHTFLRKTRLAFIYHIINLFFESSCAFLNTLKGVPTPESEKKQRAHYAGVGLDSWT